jgi:glucose 1-dehydrogenase
MTTATDVQGACQLGRELSGQWALVTGASKGIGLGIAEKLVNAGANVVLAARDRDRLGEAKTHLRSSAESDQELVCRSVDITDRADIHRLFSWVRSEIAGLNILVANAGSGTLIPFLDLPGEAWDATLALNLTGSFVCMQEAARIMVEMPDGANRSIVAVSSIRALGIRPGLAAYATSKAGLNQLVRMAAYELASHGIRVNTLSPGVTSTPLADLNPAVVAERVRDIPMGRPGSPDVMGEAALFLCSSRSAFVTGANLVIDGGESLRG